MFKPCVNFGMRDAMLRHPSPSPVIVFHCVLLVTSEKLASITCMTPVLAYCPGK